MPQNLIFFCQSPNCAFFRARDPFRTIDSKAHVFFFLSSVHQDFSLRPFPGKPLHLHPLMPCWQRSSFGEMGSSWLVDDPRKTFFLKNSKTERVISSDPKRFFFCSSLFFGGGDDRGWYGMKQNHISYESHIFCSNGKTLSTNQLVPSALLRPVPLICEVQVTGPKGCLLIIKPPGIGAAAA